MSNSSSRVDHENTRLRLEIKKLRSELKEIKRNNKPSLVLSQIDKNKLVVEIKDKLEQGIFSPPKKPLSIHKSPLNKSRRNRSKSPDFSKRKSKGLDENKENIIIPSVPDLESPNFFENKISNETIISDSFSKIYLEPSSLSNNANELAQCTVDAVQTLENENRLLKELLVLRTENEKLRTKLKHTTPNNRSRNASFAKLSKNVLPKKHSINEIEILEGNNQNFLKISPKPSRKNSCNIVKSRRTQSITEKKVLKDGNLSIHSIKPSKSPSRGCSPSHSISKSPNRSPIRVNGEESFSDIFSFTGSAQKSTKIINVKSTKSIDNTSINQRSLILKSPTNLSTRKKSPNVTPRSKHCPTCDQLLHKGFPTVTCTKHVL